jgi:hypothetical protein
VSGQPNSKPKNEGVRPAGRKPKAGGDDCDLEFELDLISLMRPALQQVVEGDVLAVDLITERDLDAVVCKRQVGGEVVGSLAAFRGLADLIDCIKRGHRYAAKVIRRGKTTCRVLVTRASA